jgi:hypothetical protein
MDREAALKHWRLGVERASYVAGLAERRYRAVDPDNRLVARGLERAWEESLRALETAKAELARRENDRPRVLSRQERSRLAALGPDLATVWHAATTTPLRLTDEHARFNTKSAAGFLPMREAIRALGVSRQTVLQRVKRGELEAVHVTRGRQKGLRIKVIARQGELFA